MRYVAHEVPAICGKHGGYYSLVRVPEADEVDWERLSERGRWILHQVALPTAIGYRPSEVAKIADVPLINVARLLVELADEVATLAAATADANAVTV